MNIRAFLLGVSCGVMLAVAGQWLMPTRSTAERPVDGPVASSTLRPPSMGLPQPDPSAAASRPTAASALAARFPAIAAATPSEPARVTSAPMRLVPGIRLSAEHAKVLMPSFDDKRPPTLPELHAKLVSETQDPNWSFDVEQSIRAFVNANNVTAEFDVMSVECRQSLCEVLVFGNLPTSGDHWNRVWDSAAKQPWYTQFKGNSTSVLVQNSRYTIVTVLHRSPT